MSAIPSDDDVIDLPTAAAEVMADARVAKAGRAGRTLTPGAGAQLKQTLLALTAGAVLADHESPGEASLQVLSGSIDLTAGDTTLRLEAGAHCPIPAMRHGVTGIEDTVVLITVAHS